MRTIASNPIDLVPVPGPVKAREREAAVTTGTVVEVEIGEVVVVEVGGGAEDTGLLS
jgi:hypothetical protein